MFKILKHILKLNTKDRQSRRDIKLSIDALNLVRGNTTHEILDTLANVKPARYPSISELDNYLKLKIQKRKIK
jgi:hypothetical protein